MADRKIQVVISADARNLERVFGKAATSAQRFNAKVTRSFGGLTRGIGAGTLGVAAFGAALKSSVGAAAQFEDTMQKLAGLSGVAQDKIAGLSSEVLKLGPSVGRSPQELADALYFITSSGIDASKAMSVLTVSAKASVAGLGETKVVADAVTSALNAYGQSNLSAQHATDVLVATVRAGKGEASDFAGVIGNVASIASQLGVSFDQVGAALASETKLGIDAETASVQLQQVFSNLLKVAPQAEKAFRSVGLSSAGLRKELRDQGLIATLETVKTAFAGDLPGLAKAFPNIRALRGVLALVGNQAEQTKAVFAELLDTSGSLATAFNAVSGDNAQKFRRLSAAIDVTKISIGAALEPAVTQVATKIADWLAVTGNQEKVQQQLTSAVKTFASVIRGVVAVIGPVVQGLGGLKNTAKLLLAVLVASKVTGYATALSGLGTEAFKAGRKVETLRLAMGNLAKIGVVTIGISVLFNLQDKATRSKIGRDAKDGLLGSALFETLFGTDFGVGGWFGGRDAQKAEDEAKRRAKAASDAAAKAVDKVFSEHKGGRGFKLPSATTSTTSTAPSSSTTTPAAGGGLTAKQRNTFFDSALARSLDRVQDIPTIKGQIAKLKQIGALITARIAATKDVTRKLNLEDQLVQVRREIGQLSDQAAQTAAQTRADAIGKFIDTLQFGVDKAGQNIPKQLAALKKLEQGLVATLKGDKKNLDLQRQLLSVQEQRKQLLLGQRNAKQFTALGLTATGEDKIPGVTALRRQLASVGDAVKGTFLDTGKTRSLIQNIRKVLAGGLGALSNDVRAKIAEMLKGIDDQLKNHNGKLTKTTSLNANTILSGLGLGRDAERQLRARLSQFNSAGIGLSAAAGTQGAFGVPAGRGDLVVNTSVNLDGQKVAANTTRHQQIRKQRNPTQKRGRTF